MRSYYKSTDHEFFQRKLSKREFDEFFWYEWNRCQERATRFSKNIARTVLNRDGSPTSRKMKMFIPYQEMLVYLILKKIYFKAFSIIKEKGKITYLDYKKMAIVIIEKEIMKNTNKAFKDVHYYERIREQVYNLLNDNFKLIDQFDIQDSISMTRRLKIDLKELLLPAAIKENDKRENIEMLKEINECFYRLDYISIIPLSDCAFSMVVTLPYDIKDDMKQRHVILGTIIKYCHDILAKEIGLEFFSLVVYFPLTAERKVYLYDAFKYIYQFMEWVKVLRCIKDKLTTTSVDHKNCEFCENSVFCEARGRTDPDTKIKKVRTLIKEPKEN